MLEFRHHDGANQLGDEPGGRAGVPYSDYTGYTPANDPMATWLALDRSTVHDVNRWQPLTYVDGSGNLVTPSFLGAHWHLVRPFAMSSMLPLRSPIGPARYGSPEFVAQAAELIDVSANLTDEQKVIAEYWADGPRSELPPGHWNLFAQWVTNRDRTGSREHDLDHAVKLFFALTNAVFDAGCCAWDNKVAFDSVRPITAIRWLFHGETIGPGPARGGHTEHRRRGVVPVPADHLPVAALCGVLVRAQQFQCCRSGDPAAVHRKRPLRSGRHGSRRAAHRSNPD